MHGTKEKKRRLADESAGSNAQKKKRKLADDSAGGRPPEKISRTENADTAAVRSMSRPRYAPPVIATMPGIQIAPGITFDAYSSKPARGRGDQELLLHSSEHRALDYTAREEKPSGAPAPLRHYLAVYDPETGRMQVMEAKKMVVRGVVRSKQAPPESMEPPPFATMAERRADLKMTFGTRKAKKALESTSLNAITPKKQPDGEPARLDNASKAVMDAIGEAAADMATREELQAAIDSAKPVPRANLDATEIHDVYNPDAMIGAAVLLSVPVGDWLDSLAKKEPVQTISRFVARRITRLASGTDRLPRLRLLRYLLFCLQFYACGRPGKVRGTLRLPNRETLRKCMEPAPDHLLDSIRRKFADGGDMRKFHVDLLMTHCCVFAAILDNFEVDTQDLREDLRLEQKAMNAYFHEVGARTKPVVDKSSGKAVTRHLAKLALPLRFPQQRRMAPRRG